MTTLHSDSQVLCLRVACVIAACVLLLQVDTAAAQSADAPVESDAAAETAAPPESEAAAEPEPAEAASATESGAEPEATTESEATTEPEATSLLDAPEFPDGKAPSSEDKRKTPDYDGRGDEPTTTGDVLLWVPRIAVLPVYLVAEYLIRVPLGAVVTTAEEDHWVASLVDFFTFTDEHNTGLIPTALIETDVSPSVGFYFFANDMFADGHDLRLRGAIWPNDWYTLALLNRATNDSGSRRLQLTGSLAIRPDYAYYGLGSESRAKDATNYSSEVYDAKVSFEGKHWRASHFSWEMGVRHRVFGLDSSFADGSDSVSLRRALADPDNRIDETPPGFDDGYTIYRQALQLSVDTRLPFPAPGHGVRLQVNGEHAMSLSDPVAQRWVRYGAALGGFLDVSHHRVLSLSLWTQFADPIAGTLPFTELAMVGGPPPLQGFALGRFHDRSAAAVLLEYRWPVWIWADAVLHYGMGNVFGQHLEGLSTDNLRSSFGFAIRAARASENPDSVVQLFVAFGTETIEQGMSIENGRVSVGASSGF